MIRRRQRVTKKPTRQTEAPPRWQKYPKYEKIFLKESKEFDKEVINYWTNYNRQGLDIAGNYRTPVSERKPFDNYFGTNKKYIKKTEYDRHYNTPFIPDFKVTRDPIKPRKEIWNEIIREEDARKVQLSINRTYARISKFTDSFLEPWYRHPPTVANYKYRNRTGVFPKVDKYKPLNSNTVNTTDLPYEFTIHRDY